MTLKTFFELYKGGLACVSIQQMPYDHEKRSYTKTYFEEEEPEAVLESDIFKSIASKQVDHFNIIGGGMYVVELCIYLKKDGTKK